MRFIMPRKTLCTLFLLQVAVLFSLFSSPASLQADTFEGESYSAYPPFYSPNTLPNVIFMMDNSGSMKEVMYAGSHGWSSASSGCSAYNDGFTPSKSYYGMFDAEKFYEYDPDIPVDVCSFGTENSYDCEDAGGNQTTCACTNEATSYNVKVQNRTGTFVEAECTPDGDGGNCWSGNFLNWLVTRRIDAARKVMVGGKVENRAGYTYTRDENGEPEEDENGEPVLTWKIVGNNEPSDHYLCRKDTKSSSSGTSGGTYYTPYPKDTLFQVESPANKGKTYDSYDPYAKIVLKSSRGKYIYALDEATGEYDKIIGEFGATGDKVTHNTFTVNLSRYYNHPVVIVSPPREDGYNASVVSLTEVKANKFSLFIHEREGEDGKHTTENVFYVVMEAGSWTLADGMEVVVKRGVEISMDDLEGGNSKTGVNLKNTAFSFSPFAAQTVTDTADYIHPEFFVASELTEDCGTHDVSYETDAIIPRITEKPVQGSPGNYSTSSIKIGFDREGRREDVCTVKLRPHIIGITQGSFTDIEGKNIVVGEKDGFTGDDDGSSSSAAHYTTLDFPETGISAFAATVQSYNDERASALRYKNFRDSAVDLSIEPAKNDPTHDEETVGYLLFGTKRYNIAVLAEEEPTGLLHDISDSVRVGSSVYRYQFDTNIYNSEWAHGGTLIAPIPYNPFVKNPGEGNEENYRIVSSHARGTTADAIDILEHYPLVWGTTPLSENLYEVGRYFKQTTQYYNGKPSISFTGESGQFPLNNYEQSMEWDPFVYNGVKESCVKNYVLLFTDGAPYKDDYVPLQDDDGVNIIGGRTYDTIKETKDCSSSNQHANSCQDNLDDVAAYLYGEDLRDDLAGKQNITTYTVGFGKSTIPAILRKAANNSDPDLVTEDDEGNLTFPNNGATDPESPQYFAAEDGLQLKEILTQVFASIASEAITGTQATPLVEQTGSGSVLSQALFFDNREFTDGSTDPDTIYEISWSGTVKNYWQYTDGDDDTIREDTCDFFHLNINADGTTTPPEDEEVSISSSTIFDVSTVWDAGEILRKRVVEANPSTTPINQLGTVRRVIFTPISEDTGISSTQLVELVTDKTDALAPYFGYENYDSCLLENTTCANASAVTCIPAELSACQAADPACDQAACDKAKLATCVKNNASVAANLIKYTRGVTDDFSTDEENPNPCRSRRVLTDAGAASGSESPYWKLGDIIYSTPKLLKYRDHGLLFVGANDGMLHVFNTGKISYDYLEDSTTYTNRVLSLVDERGVTATTSVGKELWSFIPQNILPYLKYWADPEYSHIYGVDGTPYFFSQDDHIILIMGFRLGGAIGSASTEGSTSVEDLNYVPKPEALEKGEGQSAYFALDVTDPYNPVFLWEYTHENLGYSYSGPSIITRKEPADPDHDKHYVMFLSGPTNYQGDSILQPRVFILPMKIDDKSTSDPDDDQPFSLDAEHIEIIALKDQSGAPIEDGFGGRLYSNGADIDGDGYTDIIAYGLNIIDSRNDNERQISGMLRAIAPTDDSPDQWVEKILLPTAYTTDPVTGEITVTDPINPVTNKVVYSECFEHPFLYFGTGRFFYKNDQTGMEAADYSSNILYALNIRKCKENLSSGLDCLFGLSFEDSAINTDLDTNVCEVASGEGDAPSGWKIDTLEPRAEKIWKDIEGTYAEERVISDPTRTSFNIVYFTTAQPILTECGIYGRTRVWALNCMTGDDVFEECTGDPVASNYTVNEDLIDLQLTRSRGDIDRLDGDDFEPTADDPEGDPDDGTKKTSKWERGLPPEGGPQQQEPDEKKGDVFLWEEL
ncbi:MAG: hypothetical protein CSA20_06980 [Deltaproteobacteria bacterium]|nr:MAG: hypothetical protein CSA20_06980 [Deltaproteobacteria bacterium]